jgi:hypothetical protein
VIKKDLSQSGSSGSNQEGDGGGRKFGKGAADRATNVSSPGPARAPPSPAIPTRREECSSHCPQQHGR